MRRSWLSYALVMSLLLNVGVIAAAGYHLLAPEAAAERGGDLAAHLKLDTEQRRQWQQIERSFVRELDAGWREIALHRENMIREVFSEQQPDRARIEAERARIAELQSMQQRLVIDQFLRERDILTSEQRRMLVDVLLHDQPPVPRERKLHEE